MRPLNDIRSLSLEVFEHPKSSILFNVGQFETPRQQHTLKNELRQDDKITKAQIPDFVNLVYTITQLFKVLDFYLSIPFYYFNTLYLNIR